MCLKNTTGCIPGGQLAFVWFSLAVGIGSKALHNIGKEGVCGSSLASGRKGTRLLPWQETVGQVQAASFLPARSGWLRRGDGGRAQKTVWGSSSSAAAFLLPPTSQQRCWSALWDAAAGAFYPARPSWCPTSPWGWVTTLPTSPWHGMAQHGGQQSRREWEGASQDQV